MKNKNVAANQGKKSMPKSGKPSNPTSKKKERVNKDYVIRARVTAEERERFEKKVEELGFSTVSERIRSLISKLESLARYRCVTGMVTHLLHVQGAALPTKRPTYHPRMVYRPLFVR